MIKYVKGNFFDYDADIRVNTVNCVGVMGAGAALQFKKRYPLMYKDYKNFCQKGLVDIGHPHVWTDADMFDGSGEVIINLPTKKHWRNPSTYEYVNKGLDWLRRFLMDKRDMTMTLPALGCGNGGLDWSVVRKAIETYLGDLSITILVFEPFSSVDLIPEMGVLLKNKGIAYLSAQDKSYPFRLNQDWKPNIYVQGDVSILSKKLFSIIVNSKADEREREAVIKCVKTLPKNDFVYLLGFGSSFEIDVVKLILEKGSKVVVVVPYGILNLKVRQDLKMLWGNSSVVVVSLSNNPAQVWNVNESITALQFRIKVADGVLISNRELKSLVNLEQDFKDSLNRKFYINYWSIPKEFYKRIDAQKIGRDRRTHSPNISPILEVMR